MTSFEEFPPMALKGRCGSVERVEGKESVLDGEKKAAVIDEIHELKMDKAAVGTWKAAAAIGKVQKGKKQKKRKAKRTAAGTGKSDWGAQSDPPAGKHRIPDDYVRLILALKKEEPMENPYLLPGSSAFEEARQQYAEEVAIFKRTYDDFEPFQAMVRKEWYAKGYVEVDYDYVAGLARANEAHKEDWDHYRKHMASLEYIEYADPDDPVYADFYAPYNPEVLLEQFNLVEASKKMTDLELNPTK